MQYPRFNSVTITFFSKVTYWQWQQRIDNNSIRRIIGSLADRLLGGKTEAIVNPDSSIKSVVGDVFTQEVSDDSDSVLANTCHYYNNSK